MTPKTLEREVLKLSEKQRAALAGRILESLEPDDDDPRLLHVPRSAAVVRAEIKRRIEEADRDPSILIPHQEVMARLRKVVDEARPPMLRGGKKRPRSRSRA